MADTLLEARHAAAETRERGADCIDAEVLARIRNHYHGALARGQTDNQGKRTTLAADARTLITRFRRFEDMILRFATDLVPFTTTRQKEPSGPSKSSNAPPVAAGAPCKDSSTSPSSTLT